MADEFTDKCQRCTGLELMNDESVSQIVDFGIFDAGKFEETVDGCPNIADQEGIAGFGEKESLVIGFGTIFEVVFDSTDGGIGEGDGATIAGFVGADDDSFFLQINIIETKVGKFANAHAGLEEDFDNGGESQIVTAGVAEGAVL